VGSSLCNVGVYYASLRFGRVTIGGYGLGPIAAAYEPYRAGAELFTLTTVVSTEIMHLVSGAWILTALLTMARARVSSGPS